MSPSFPILVRRCVVLLSLVAIGSLLAAQESADLLKKRQDWFYRQRAYPLAHVPAGARLRAQQQLDHMLAVQRTDVAGASAPAQWTLLGPFGSVPFANDGGGGAPDAAGRVTALAVDPRNGDVAYLGGAMGGIWKTTDGGRSWTALTDQQASLAIGSIALAPSNPDIVYAGTGEGNQGIDSYYGAGILKSTDAGVTWMQIAAPFVGPFETGGPAFGGGAYIAGIAVQPNNASVVLAATQLLTTTADQSGIYRSTDGGATWSKTLSGDVFQVFFDPANPSRAFTAVCNGASCGFGSVGGKGGFYVSNDAGATWTKLSTFGLAASAIGRVAMALAPSASSTLYAAVADDTQASDVLAGVMKSSDQGATWTKLTIPDYCNPQCWYDDVVAVHPSNPNVVFFGGSALTTGSFLRSTDGGATAGDVSGILSLAPARLHVDHHAIAFSADGTKMYEGNDGGAWRTTDPLANPIAWASLNAALALTQFYPGPAIHPTNAKIIFGGTQDNSTQLYGGTVNWTEVNCGDGAYNAIDSANPSIVYGTCAADGMLYKSTAGGAAGSWVEANTVPLVAGTLSLAGDGDNFTPPFALDPAKSGRLYFGTYRVYRSTDGASTWAIISGDVTSGQPGVISTVAVSAKDANSVWVGTTDGRVQFTQSATTAVGCTKGTTCASSNLAAFTLVTTGLPRRYVTAIAVNPLSGAAYVGYSGFTGFDDNLGHIFAITVNSGVATVSDISGNLPNVPVNAVLADPDVSNTIYVGTDVGVFYTSDGGVTWNPMVAGLPHVAVLGLAFQHAGRLLVAATHGRSMWTITAPVTAPNPVPAIASLTPASAPAASGAFNLTVNGTNFVTTSQVLWNGTARATTFISSTQLVAAIAAADVGAAGSAQVTVLSPTPGGGTSNAVSFTINSVAAPDISNLSPGTATAGSASTFTLTLNGSGFSTNSVVQWNGSPRSTLFVSSTQLQAALNASDLTAAGAAHVNVVTPGPIAPLTSNTVDFYVTAPGALPLAKQAYWPHIVSGAGYVTKMTITNLKPANNDVIVFFFSTSGAALPAMSFTLAPGETSRFSTPESARFGAANITWAIVNSQDTVGLNLFFEVEDPNTGAIVNAVGFNDQAALTDMTLPLEIQPAPAGANAGRTVGLAFANPDPAATANITMSLLDRKGNVLATAPITLAPRSHATLDVQSFPAFAAVLPNANFIGSLTINSSVPIAVSGLLDDLGPFSALPPMPGRAK